MIKNELAIDVFKRFVEDNGRMPTYKEFKALNYSISHYYRVKKIYLEEKEEKINDRNLERH